MTTSNISVNQCSSVVKKNREDTLRENMDFQNKIQFWLHTGRWPDSSPKNPPSLIIHQE